MRKMNLRTSASRFLSDDRGNVLMIMALAVIPVMATIGSGVDYGRAAKSEIKLNAIADAASILGVNKVEFAKADSKVVATDVQRMFNAQAGLVPDVTYDPSSLQITIHDVGGATPMDTTITNGGAPVSVNTTNGGATHTRTVTVSYTATSKNIFMPVIGAPTSTIGGTSSSSATDAPNIDFYLMLDTSPSMALPTTQAGIDQMNTQTGCAFACHQTSLASSGETTTVNGTKMDFYTFATKYANPTINLRIDSEKVAVADLANVAQSTSISNKVIYRMGVNSFDVAFNTVYYDSPTNTQNLVSVSDTGGVGVQKVTTASSNLNLLQMYSNSHLVQGDNNNDQDTDFKNAFTKVSALMPLVPGDGSTPAKPQAMLFIVTDGMSDENLPGYVGPQDGSRTHRELQQAHLDQCTAIKARGIRIAILYTEYLSASISSNSFGQHNIIAPPTPPGGYLPLIPPALTNCASPGLMYTVTTGQDISAALTALFKTAVATAHITH